MVGSVIDVGDLITNSKGAALGIARLHSFRPARCQIREAKR